MKAEEFAACAPDSVLNQPPALENYNLYECDRPLREAVAREGGGWVEEQAREFGALLGRTEILRLGELANRHPPVLHSMIALVTASTKLNFIPRGTNSCG